MSEVVRWRDEIKLSFLLLGKAVSLSISHGIGAIDHCSICILQKVDYDYFLWFSKNRSHDFCGWWLVESCRGTFQRFLYLSRPSGGLEVLCWKQMYNQFAFISSHVLPSKIKKRIADRYCSFYIVWKNIECLVQIVVKCIHLKFCMAVIWRITMYDCYAY